MFQTAVIIQRQSNLRKYLIPISFLWILENRNNCLASKSCVVNTIKVDFSTLPMQPSLSTLYNLRNVYQATAACDYSSVTAVDSPSTRRCTTASRCWGCPLPSTSRGESSSGPVPRRPGAGAAHCLRPAELRVSKRCFTVGSQ